ncbi:glycoside hydrolase family 76 protein [Actinopolymorpha singaporensis]|uniref:Glycosyl hydrolase family 76 n=1 Tax=Actinopolymorpha singaporensis TaxID=117157 RepID=A0A1H1MH92_9ACTN|nr:glycoside hydrolase family 76 protein [Actinopolymorpha singaporensis]SDR86201.1 Glycosyl hydrolase family 76 [Actinopolymorpha singaporensis]
MSQHFSTPSRRAVLLGGVAAATTAAVGAVSTTPAYAGTVSTANLSRYARRAQASYAALQRYFYDPKTSLYLEEYPHAGGNPYSYVWPFSQAMVATQDMAGLPGVGARYAADVADRFTAVEKYWNDQTDPPGYDSYLRPPLGQGGDKFYDDNEWIGLADLQHHLMTPGGHAPSMRRAAQIFDLVVFGWDDDPTHPCPGGVFWTQAPWSHDRNTVSNAPGAEVGLRLYLITRQPRYLEWSTRMYDWTRTYMLAPNGLYWDHVDLAGNIQKTQWSYNQGVMIGAGVLLHRATGSGEYLDQAEDTAKKALAFYAENERYFTQPARFHAIFFANLLQLSTLRPDPAYREAMQWYADQSYQRFRDPKTGLYRFEGANPVTLLEQSGMVRIEAMLGWSPANYGKLT